MKPPVGLADVVRAAHALAPRGDAVDLLLDMCGLERMPDVVPPSDDGHDTFHDGETQDVVDTDIDDIGPVTTIPPGVRHLEPVSSESTSRVPVPDDPLNSDTGERATRPVGFEGLLSDRVSTDLLRSAGTVGTPSDRVDLDAILDALEVARPLLTLPRLVARTLTAGLHVIVDIGDAMEPFTEDQDDVLAHLRRAVGRPITVSYVADDPDRRAGPERRRVTWTTFEPPPVGRPVVVLSDLGCGFPVRPTAVRAWRSLSRTLRGRGNRVVVLAPTRAKRIPLEFAQGCEIVIWDRTTGRRQAADLARLTDV